MVKGYSKKYDIDYEEVSIRVLIAFAAQICLELHHMKLNCAFLNGKIVQEIYVVELEGFAKKEKGNCGFEIEEGLKKAPMAWFFKFDQSLSSLDYLRSNDEKVVKKHKLLIRVYVDALIVNS